MDNGELEALLELREFQFRQKSQQTLKEDTLICECRCVSVAEIKEALITGNKKSVDFEFLKEQLGLGSGCSTCLKNADSWIGRIQLSN